MTKVSVKACEAAISIGRNIFFNFDRNNALNFSPKEKPIIHIIGHTFAAVIFWDRGHMFHVAKGGAELLRGIIAMIPIVGRIFVWKYDATEPCCGGGYTHATYSYSFFVVKIHNPDDPDLIDNYFLNEERHPCKI